MATAERIKRDLRIHLNVRMDDVRKLKSDWYRDIAYGAIWAANCADAISDDEREALLNEINGRTPLGTCPAL